MGDVREENCIGKVKGKLQLREGNIVWGLFEIMRHWLKQWENSKKSSMWPFEEHPTTSNRAISKKMALFWDILSTQKAKFQIWYLSEFLVVLWPKYVVINKTTLGIHKNGQIKIFVKIPIGLCAQIW